MSRNLKNDQFIGVIESSYFDVIKSLKNPNIRMLSCMDLYDSTYFNKKQVNQLRKEVKILELNAHFKNEHLKILNYAIDLAGTQEDFYFLVFVGD